MDVFNNQVEEEKINVRDFLLKISGYWYWFVISLVIALAIAYVINKTSIPLYRVQSSVLVHEEHSMLDTKFASDLGLYDEQHELSNEIGILKSYDLIQRTVHRLDFEVQYYRDGRFIHHEIFSECPFRVWIDSSHVQPLFIQFEVLITGPDRFILSVKAKNVGIYNVRLNKETNYLPRLLFRKTDSLFSQVKTNFMNITLLPGKHKNLSSYIGKSFYFELLNEDAVISGFRNIRVSETSNSSILTLSAVGPNVEKLTMFLNTLTNEYLMRGVEKKNRIAENTIRFIDSQIGDVSDSLHHSETRLEAYKADNALLDVDFQSQQVYTSFQNLQDQKAALVVKRKYFEYLKKYLSEKQTDGRDLVAPTSIDIQDPNLNSLISDLTQLLNDRSELSGNSGKANPFLTSIDLRIHYLKKSILNNLDNLMNASDIAIQDIDNRIKKLSTQLNSLPGRQRKLVNIERKYKLNDALYTYLLTKRSEVQISKASYLPNNEVIDRARMNEYSLVSPNVRKNYMFAFILGLGFPMGLFLFVIYFNDRILVNEDIEKISSYPVLGHILRSREQSATVVADYPNSLCSESIRAIRTSFQFLANEHKHHVILVTSSMMSEGKSFTCTNLALSFGLNGKKVLLMNFDLRKPKLHAYLSMESDKGLSSYLSGNSDLEDIILKTRFENIDVIFSGPVPPNPMELIASEYTRLLFEKIKEKYDYIIIDSPPVGLVADSLLLIPFSDVHIFVIRHNMTRKKIFSQVNQNLTRKGIHNFNIILNDVNIGRKYFAYSHGYGYTYGYGYGYGENKKSKKQKGKKQDR